MEAVQTAGERPSARFRLGPPVSCVDVAWVAFTVLVSLGLFGLGWWFRGVTR